MLKMTLNVKKQAYVFDCECPDFCASVFSACPAEYVKREGSLIRKGV